MLALSCGFAVAAAPSSQAETILLPTDLKPGQTFQIAFLTTGTVSAASTDIAFYNNYVTQAAAAAGLDVINGQAVTWNAIFSTSSIDARDNAAQTSPVYNLDMKLVTANPGGLWNESPFFLKNPINVTETGDALTTGYAWTGSDTRGRYSPGPSPGRGQILVGLGEFRSTFPNWLSSAYFPPTNLYHLYALSSPITVFDPNNPPGSGPGGDPGGPGSDPGGDPGGPGSDPGGDPGGPGGDPGGPGDPGGDPGGPIPVPEASSIRLGILSALSMMTRWVASRRKVPGGERSA